VQAQMVESSTAKAAEMAARLDAVHRWAVTGTPLSRGLEDLFGLLLFLRAAPLDQRAWWLRVCQRPYEAGCAAGAARPGAALARRAWARRGGGCCYGRVTTTRLVSPTRLAHVVV